MDYVEDTGLPTNKPINVTGYNDVSIHICLCCGLQEYVIELIFLLMW